MALQRVFTAQDLLAYSMLWDADATYLYNEYLTTYPRIYPEEIYMMDAQQPTIGPLWVTEDPTPYSKYTLNYLSAMAQRNWPSWNVVRWRFDTQYGHLIPPPVRPSDPPEEYDPIHERWAGGHAFGGVGTAIGGMMTPEPTGEIWWFGTFPDTFHGGAVRLNPEDMSIWGEGLSTMVIRTDDFLDQDGNAPIQMEDFAIDRGADRMFVRWITSNMGEVCVYRLSTKQYLHSIYTPNKTRGIVLTRDGFAYVHDIADWICLYSYEGVFHGAVRNLQAEINLGTSYGWDWAYKRLLALRIVPNATNGASQSRIVGYYPVPEPTFLTAPIPRQVPRVGRKIMVFARAGGCGGEPFAARQAEFSGALTGSIATDLDGEAVFPITPLSNGSVALTVTIQAPAGIVIPDTPPDPDPETPVPGGIFDLSGLPFAVLNLPEAPRESTLQIIDENTASYTVSSDDMTVSIAEGVTLDELIIPTYRRRIIVQGPGTIGRVAFEPPDGVLAHASDIVFDAVHFTPQETVYNEVFGDRIAFLNCTSEGTGYFCFMGVHGTPYNDIIFQGCTARVSGSVTACIRLESAYRVMVRNCTTYTGGRHGVRIHGVSEDLWIKNVALRDYPSQSGNGMRIGSMPSIPATIGRVWVDGTTCYTTGPEDIDVARDGSVDVLNASNVWSVRQADLWSAWQDVVSDPSPGWEITTSGRRNE